MSDWYFTRYGRQIGPVSMAQLQLEIDNGRVGPDDLVWNNTMTDWKPVRAVPQLRSGAVAARPAVATAQPRQMSYGGIGADGMVTAQTVQLLAETQPWVRSMSVLMFLAASSYLILGLLLILALSKMPRGGPPLVTSTLPLLMMVLFSGTSIAQAVFLWKYASAIALLRESPRVANLETALRYQRTFWRVMGSISLTIAGLIVIGMVFAFGAAVLG